MASHDTEIDVQELNQLRALLCRLQDGIRDALLMARDMVGDDDDDFSQVAELTAADTIYRIDKISEATILEWFEIEWPDHQSVELVMEGLEGEAVCFPRDVAPQDTRWKCIIDPIDGTRGLMYDKRSAWSLAALAPQRGNENTLQDIVVAAMTELPTSKQWRADQISGVRGCGLDGLLCQMVNVNSGSRHHLTLQPSQAENFLHGFASTAHFFPEGKALLSQVEEDLWAQLHKNEPKDSPLVFDDQYISSGGQLYEVLAGHDRMVGDLRPLAFAKLGLSSALSCHPYDICTAMLLQEAGGLVEAPDGSALSVPLDTTSPVAWMAYANETLAAQVRPVLQELIGKHLR